MKTLQNRRPARKPVRSCNAAALDESRRLYVLTIKADGKTDEYDVERVGSNEGDEFVVVKRVGGNDECPVYRVVLADEGCRCNCLGFTHHRHCRHVSALQALSDAGRLS